jgi:hypothetical protein
MPTDESAKVAVQADALADQTLHELDALDAALAQVNTLPVQPPPAPPVTEDALPLEKRKELARTAVSRIADIVELNEADNAAAQVAPPPVPAAAATNPEEEIARIKAGITQ